MDYKALMDLLNQKIPQHELEIPRKQSDDTSINDFLNNEKQVESSGGIDRDHPVMMSGLHKGQSAYGDYGLMPNTIKEQASRMVRDNEDPGMADLKDMPSEEVSPYMDSHPELEEPIARSLAQHVLNKQNGDELKSAYSWNMGDNLKPDQITDRNYMQDPYVQKYQKIKDMLNSKVAKGK